MLATKHLLIRKFYNPHYPPLEVQFDAGILEFTIFSMFFPSLAAHVDVTEEMMLTGTVAGIAIFCGVLCVNLAIAEGHAAIAEQLIATFCIWQTILCLEVGGQSINSLQFNGLLVGACALGTLGFSS